MKITFLLTQSLEDPSGLGRYRPLAEELAELGYEVLILALHPNFEAIQPRRFRQNGVTVQYVAPMHIWKRGNLKGYYPAWQLPWIVGWATIMLTWHAVRHSAEVIHLGKVHPMNGIAGLIASWWHGIPLHVDCDDLEALSNRFQHGLQQSMVRWWEKQLPRWATSVTVNTTFLQNYFIQQGVDADKISIVPNGVSRHRFQPVSAEQIQSLRQQLGLPHEKVIMYVGSLSLLNHPVDLLIAAFAQVSQTMTNVRLLLVGGGEDLPAIQTQIQELELNSVVQCIGRVNPTTIPAYLSLATVTVEPIHADEIALSRSPLKIFESLAVGTPVITGDVGERRKILADGQAGLLIKAGDVSALAEGIISLVNAKETLMVMREQCLEQRNHYYWDVLAKQFAKVY